MRILNKEYNNLSKYSREFTTSKPYPHIVLDNFLDKSFFSKLDIENFSSKPKKKLIFDSDLEKNKWTSKNNKLSGDLDLIVNKLNSSEFIKNLYKLSKINNLFSTKLGNTALANYHEMYKSGYLGTHVDHSSEPSTGFPHVLNIILYLSKNWEREWGGATILANQNGTKILKEIDYIPNRAVIFLHTPFTFHGVTKLQNNLVKRSSIYVDYYTSDLDPYSHLKLDFKNVWFKHPTTFILPKFRDFFLKKNRKYLVKMIKHKIKSILA